MNKRLSPQITSYLKEKVEIPLTSFIKEHSLLLKKSGVAFPVPNHLKKMAFIKKGNVRCEYPEVKKDVFTKNAGYKLEEVNKQHGTIDYLGNISIELILEEKQRKIEVEKYCYKFWYSDNKYITIDKNDNQCRKINFNFRIDKHKRHSAAGLEFHTAFLHTQPRIFSTDLSVENFLKFIKEHVLLLTREVANEILTHISESNRLA